MKIALIVCLALSVASQCMASDVPELKDGQVWFQEHQLTSDASKKSAPVLSRSGKLIAYYNFAVQGDGQQTKATIIDLSGQKVREIIAQSEGGYACASILQLIWLSEDRLGIECHNTPSSSTLYVYQVSSGKLMGEMGGFAFTPSPDGGDIAHVGRIPHFADPEAKSYRLEINGKEIYPRERTGWVPDWREFSFPPGFAWSPAGEMIAFVETIPKREAQALRIVTRDGKLVKSLQIKYGAEIANLKWESASVLKFEAGGTERFLRISAN